MANRAGLSRLRYQALNRASGRASPGFGTLVAFAVQRVRRERIRRYAAARDRAP